MGGAARPEVIPAHLIDAWAGVAPWATRKQVEQDLVLSRLIVEIASHPQVRDELVLRGGACLHKVVLASPRRFTAGLGYARASHSPIGTVLDAVREIADGIGMTTRTDVGPFPKLRMRAPCESGAGGLAIRVGINTYETVPARPTRRIPFAVESEWWSGRADVLTFQVEEVLATKLRALHQRRQARDLFDLWVALAVLGVDAVEVVACFAPYRPAGYTAHRAEAVLGGHLADPGFRADLDGLFRAAPGGGDADAAAALVSERLLSRV